MKKLSRRELIIKMFEKDKRLTCQQITKAIIKKQKLSGSVAHYLSGSISTILNGLIKKGILTYSYKSTQRGGHIYELEKPES